MNGRGRRKLWLYAFRGLRLYSVSLFLAAGVPPVACRSPTLTGRAGVGDRFFGIEVGPGSDAPARGECTAFCHFGGCARNGVGVRCWWDGTSFLSPIRTSWRAAIPRGLLGFGAHQAAFLVGLNHTTAGSAALIMGTNPLWTAVLGWVLGAERLGPGGWGGFMLALTKRLVDRASSLAATFFGVLAALPVLLWVGAVSEPTVSWGAVGGWAWGSLLFSGGLAVGLMVVFWNRAVRRVGSLNTAVYYYLVPFVALVAGPFYSGSPSALCKWSVGG